jgi:RNA polymerase sigma-70 factor (ECF subfamily)
MILPNADASSGHVAPAAAGDRANGLPTGHTATSAEADQQRAELNALVTRARDGDLAAQSDLIHQYSRRISGYVKAIVRRSDAVEDLTQTVLIKMVRRLPRLRDPALFESWLFTMSRHVAFDYIRSCHRRPSTTASEAVLSELSDAQQTDFTREILAELEMALNHVSPMDRRLMTRLVQGDNYRDLAAQHGLSTAAVKVRLHRIRPFLRSRLRDTAETSLREAARCRAASTRVACAA